MRSRSAHPTPSTRRSTPVPAFVMAVVALVACGEDAPPTGTDNPLDPSAFFADSLPPWSVYSPPRASEPAAASGPASSLGEVVLDEVENVNVDGSIDTLTNQTYICTETPFSVTETPERLVMYSPDAQILWAGGFIQGRSRKDLGSLQGLVVDERALQNRTGSANATHVVEMHPTSGRLALAGVTARSQCCWDVYTFRAANLDGVNGADLIYWAQGSGFHSSRANGVTDFGQSRATRSC